MNFRNVRTNKMEKPREKTKDVLRKRRQVRNIKRGVTKRSEEKRGM